MKTQITLTKEDIEQFNKRTDIGIKQVFNSVFKQLHIYIFLKINDYHEAEDIAIRIILKLVDSNAKFENEKEILSWLAKAGKRKCIDYARSAKRKQRNATKDIEQFGAMIYEETQDPKAVNDLFEKMYSLIEKKLPPACKRIVKMRLAGIDTKRICIATGTTKDTVWSHYHYAVKQLKKMWNER